MQNYFTDSTFDVQCSTYLLVKNFAMNCCTFCLGVYDTHYAFAFIFVVVGAARRIQQVVKQNVHEEFDRSLVLSSVFSPNTIQQLHTLILLSCSDHKEFTKISCSRFNLNSLFCNRYHLVCLLIQLCVFCHKVQKNAQNI